MKKKIEYVKVPYYCRKCNKTWKVPFPKRVPGNGVWNIINVFLLFLLGGGVFARSPDLYCPNCHESLRRVEED